MMIIKINNAFIMKDSFSDSITFNILGHISLIEDLNMSVIPKSYTAVSCIIKLSDDISMLEGTYHRVRYEGRCEYSREPEGSPLIKSGCSCSGTG